MHPGSVVGGYAWKLAGPADPKRLPRLRYPTSINSIPGEVLPRNPAEDSSSRYWRRYEKGIHRNSGDKIDLFLQVTFPVSSAFL